MAGLPRLTDNYCWNQPTSTKVSPKLVVSAAFSHFPYLSPSGGPARNDGCLSVCPARVECWRFLELYSLGLKSLVVLGIGGILVGFGTRYASGCTSGHAITGLATLQLKSLTAVIGIFGGGLLTAHFVTPHLV